MPKVRGNNFCSFTYKWINYGYFLYPTSQNRKMKKKIKNKIIIKKPTAQIQDNWVKLRGVWDSFNSRMCLG